MRDDKMKVKASLQGIETLVAIVVFSSAFAVFLYGAGASLSSTRSAELRLSSSLYGSLELQHSYFIAQYASLGGGAAARLWPGVTSVAPFQPYGNLTVPNFGTYRIIELNGSLYYLEVHSNETPDQP